MRFAISLVTLFALAGGAAAQVVAPPVPDRFKDTTPTVLDPGQTLEVHFEDASKPNQSVSVTANNLGDPDHPETIVIQLGPDGKGQADFDPPSDWDAVTLKHPTSQDHVVPIDN